MKKISRLLFVILMGALIPNISGAPPAGTTPLQFYPRTDARPHAPDATFPNSAFETPEALVLGRFHRLSGTHAYATDLVGANFPVESFVGGTGPTDTTPPAGKIFLGNGSTTATNSTALSYDTYPFTMSSSLPFLQPVSATTGKIYGPFTGEGGQTILNPAEDIVILDNGRPSVGVIRNRAAVPTGGSDRYTGVPNIYNMAGWDDGGVGTYPTQFVYAVTGHFTELEPGMVKKDDIAILDRYPRSCSWVDGDPDAGYTYTRFDGFIRRTPRDPQLWGYTSSDLALRRVSLGGHPYCGTLRLLHNKTGTGLNFDLIRRGADGLNNSSGLFIPLGINPSRAASCDFDGDGSLDLVVTNSGIATGANRIIGSIEVITHIKDGPVQITDYTTNGLGRHPWQVVTIPRGNTCDFAVSYLDSNSIGTSTIDYYRLNSSTGFFEPENVPLQQFAAGEVSYIGSADNGTRPVGLGLLRAELPFPENITTTLLNKILYPKFVPTGEPGLILAVAMNNTRNVALFRIGENGIEVDNRQVIQVASNEVTSGPKVIISGLVNLVKPGMNPQNAYDWIKWAFTNNRSQVEPILRAVADLKMDLGVISGPVYTPPEAPIDLSGWRFSSRSLRQNLTRGPLLALRALLSISEARAWGLNDLHLSDYFGNNNTLRGRLTTGGGRVSTFTPTPVGYEVGVLLQKEDQCEGQPTQEQRDCCKRQLGNYPPPAPPSNNTNAEFPQPFQFDPNRCTQACPDVLAARFEECPGPRVRCQETTEAEINARGPAYKADCCELVPDMRIIWGCPTDKMACFADAPETIWNEQACCEANLDILAARPAARSGEPLNEAERNQLLQGCCAGLTGKRLECCIKAKTGNDTMEEFNACLAGTTIINPPGPSTNAAGQRVIYAVVPEKQEEQVNISVGGGDPGQQKTMKEALQSESYSVRLTQRSGLDISTRADEMATLVTGPKNLEMAPQAASTGKETRLLTKPTDLGNPTLKLTLIGQTPPPEVNVIVGTEEMQDVTSFCLSARESGDQNRIVTCLDKLCTVTDPPCQLTSEFQADVVATDGTVIDSSVIRAANPVGQVGGGFESVFKCSVTPQARPLTMEGLLGSLLPMLLFAAGFVLVRLRIASSKI